MFCVIGCWSPRYFDADCAAFAYEFSEAWYYREINSWAFYLFEELLFDGDIVVADAQHDQPIFRLLILVRGTLRHDQVLAADVVLRDQFVLDQN